MWGIVVLFSAMLMMCSSLPARARAQARLEDSQESQEDSQEDSQARIEDSQEKTRAEVPTLCR